MRNGKGRGRVEGGGGGYGGDVEEVEKQEEVGEVEVERRGRKVNVVGISGRECDLPCRLSPRTPDDKPKLILWYKKGNRSPIF
ncbi:hypothetical protein Pcinc_028338, partial [Petrolisthes cinctipes]